MSAPIYNPDRTFLVDQVGTNFLMRGNQPLLSDGTTFAYNEMNTKFKSLVGGNFDLTNYKLLDISIIDDNPNSERPVLEAEFATFGMSQADFNKNFPWPGSWPPALNNINMEKQYGTVVCGHPGSVVWYPVQGCVAGSCEDVENRQFQFFKLVDFVRNCLETENNTVIYVHCEHGHDRTSAVCGSYMIKFMGTSVNDVLNQAPPVGAKAFNHPWEPTYQQLVTYYSQNYTPASVPV